ncbi:MAG: cobalamin biosynthesis protein [Pseudomonadota bacterium]|nr:cobalamin biosynthesis protein [Pseudomonadota bacterium]
MAFELPFFSTSAWQTILLALVSSLLVIPSQYHPTPLFRLLISKMAGRIYDTNASKVYASFSSLLLSCLIVGCVAILAIGITSFAQYPVAFELLILFLLINNPYSNAKLKRAAWLLTQQQKPVVRDILSQFLRRDSNNLSESGLIKAIVEHQSLSYFRHFFLPLILYYCLGFNTALIYCLFLHCANVFSKTAPPDSQFSNATNAIIYYLEFLPIRLFCLPLLLKPKTQGFRYLALFVDNGYQKNSCFLLACLSGYLGVQLGGPAFYSGKRYSKTRIGPKTLPQQKSIKQAKNALMFASIFWLCLILFLEIIYAATNHL